jgi:hypothetical protein
MTSGHGKLFHDPANTMVPIEANTGREFGTTTSQKVRSGPSPSIRAGTPARPVFEPRAARAAARANPPPAVSSERREVPGGRRSGSWSSAGVRIAVQYLDRALWVPVRG